MSSAVSCTGLVKNFGEISAIKDISLEIPKGELFGIIGPDGAGKTTLFRILVSLLLPDKGEARVLGLDTVHDYRAIRRNIGYMPGRFSLYYDLTVKENLSFYASVFNADIKKNYHLISSVYDQLQPFSNRRAGNLSGGMKQKLALSCALIHEPELLILDEPTTGVDAVSRIEFWDTLNVLKENGMTILVSTPYMDEANRCDRIALIQKGSVMRIDTPDSLISSFSETIYAARGADRFAILKQLEKIQGVDIAYLFGQEVHFVLKGTELDVLKESFGEDALTDLQVIKIKPTVEDCFINLMT